MVMMISYLGQQLLLLLQGDLINGITAVAGFGYLLEQWRRIVDQW